MKWCIDKSDCVFAVNVFLLWRLGMLFCSGGLAFFFAVEAGRGFCGGRARCEDVPSESAGKWGVPLPSRCGLCHGASEDILSGRFRESSCQASRCNLPCPLCVAWKLSANSQRDVELTQRRGCPCFSEASFR